MPYQPYTHQWCVRFYSCLWKKEKERKKEKLRKHLW